MPALQQAVSGISTIVQVHQTHVRVIQTSKAVDMLAALGRAKLQRQSLRFQKVVINGGVIARVEMQTNVYVEMQ